MRANRESRTSHRNPPSRRTGAFTLIELAIVLIVIGIVAAGIMQGQSMIRQARVMSVMTDVSAYANAANEFKQQYSAWPGDMSNATQYWGALASPGNTTGCYQTPGDNSTATCDGNGDGQIGPWCSGYEGTLFWKHLSNAGMIAGSFRQSGSGTCWTMVPGADAPKTRVPSSFLAVGYVGIVANGDCCTFPGKYGHALNLVSGTYGPALTPTEAQNLDTKFDDGTPATGSIRAMYNNPCTTSTNISAKYNVSLGGSVCNLWFVMGF